jgi:predicted Co/Zn/Cd cation transporter (cation efflux family)
MSLEHRALKVTLIGNLSMALLGIVFAMLTASGAVLLDGVFSGINVLISLVSIRIARKVGQPDDAHYPFGYAIFEPILNIGKGLILASVSIYALLASVEILLSGGREIGASIAIVYAAVAGIGCIFLSTVLQRINRICKSPIVALDVENWWIDGLVSAGVGLSFALTLAIRSTSFAWLAAYMDSLLVIVIVLATLPIPIRVVRDNWKQIIGETDPEISDRIKAVVEPFVNREDVFKIHLRQGRLGRVLYVQVYLLVNKSFSCEIASQDQLREQIYKQLRRWQKDIAIDVVFTSEQEWIRRSVIPEPVN